LGPDVLGFTPDQIGLHSARSGAAMAMFLAGIPVFTIMLMGRWSSDAFLRYIRKQVKEFSLGVSSKMIQNENFFTIQNTMTNETRLSNNPVNHAQRFIHGPDVQDTIRPLVSVFH
jgi:hypothetical protein